MDQAGIDVVHVPYKGTSPALTDTIAGNTQIVFGTVASTIPHVKGGKLRALAVSTPKRLPALPDVPTAMELGYKDYQVVNWHGLIGPKGMPADIVAKMVEGSVQKYLKEVSLVDQVFGKAADGKQTVGAMLKATSTAVKGFTLYVVGEGIEKKVDDFAAEVAAQVAAAQAGA